MASVALGANEAHTLKAFLEAGAACGPVDEYRLRSLYRARI